MPEATALFWIVKILTTAMGEATSDYLVTALIPEIAAALALVCLIVALVLQFKADRYIPWIYWLTVVMVAIFGTMAADILHAVFGIPYIVTTTFYAVLLAIIFIVWYAIEKTLSIHSIDTRRREIFYWLTVLTTFALGTALGDMTATTLGWGFLASGIIFAIIIAIPAIAHWKLKLNAIFAFWFAYIITRPLGASFADWLGKPSSIGGVGLGDGTVSLILTILIIGFVWYLTATHEDVERHHAK